MVKVGDYYDYALSLSEKMVDYNPLEKLTEDKMCFGTVTCIILECAKKIKDLEERIKVLEGAKEIPKT